MRFVFRLLGWFLVIGVIANLGVLAIGVYDIAEGGFQNWGLRVEGLIQARLDILGWTRDVANAVLPQAWVDQAYALPVVILMPIKIIVGLVLARFFFGLAKR